MSSRSRPSAPLNLTEPEQRMLGELCHLDNVSESEALRRAIRLAFFCRVVPDEVVLQTVGPNPPVDHDPNGWRPTGEVRVSVRGELVSERVHPDGSTRWVPATQDEIERYFDRGRRR